MPTIHVNKNYELSKNNTTKLWQNVFGSN